MSKSKKLASKKVYKKAPSRAALVKAKAESFKEFKRMEAAIKKLDTKTELVAKKEKVATNQVVKQSDASIRAIKKMLIVPIVKGLQLKTECVFIGDYVTYDDNAFSLLTPEFRQIAETKLDKLFCEHFASEAVKQVF